MNLVEKKCIININRINNIKLINKSINTLRNIVNFTETHEQKCYSDSALTNFMQNILEGKTYSIMIGTISPCISCFQETLNTLNICSKMKLLLNKYVDYKKCNDEIISQINNNINKDQLSENLIIQINQLKKSMKEIQPDFKNDIFYSNFINIKDLMLDYEQVKHISWIEKNRLNEKYLDEINEDKLNKECIEGIKNEIDNIINILHNNKDKYDIILEGYNIIKVIKNTQLERYNYIERVLYNTKELETSNEDTINSLLIKCQIEKKDLTLIENIFKMIKKGIIKLKKQKWRNTITYPLETIHEESCDTPKSERKKIIIDEYEKEIKELNSIIDEKNNQENKYENEIKKLKKIIDEQVKKKEIYKV